MTTPLQNVAIRRPHELALVNIQGWSTPGIMEDVHDRLWRLHIEVEEHSTTVRQAPHCGGEMFAAELSLFLPLTTSQATVEETLNSLGDDIVVDWRW